MNDSSVTSGPAEDAIAVAWAMVEQNQSPDAILAAVQHVAPGDGRFAQAQHLRSVCAARQGDLQRAKVLLIDAIRHGENSMSVWLNLARIGAALGLPDDVLAMLLDVVKRVASPQLYPFTQRLLGVLGFATKEPDPRKDVVFDKLMLPILSELLERRDMDGALALEDRLYTNYVKSTETEVHFERSMSRMEPLFTRAAHTLRAELPPLPPPSMAPPYKVGFFIHSASMLAHIEVLLSALKGYRMLDDQPFEPTVYCFSGRRPEMAQALAQLNVRLVMLHERFPETATSHWQRLLRLRELLAEEGVQQLVWVSLVTMMPLAFGIRLAPVQTWFAMKYRNFSQEDIDGYVSGSALTRFGMIGGRRWRTAMLGVDDWYDPTVEEQARELRRTMGDRVVVMTLARTEKMRDPIYLQAIAEILQTHPQALFLWAGREEDAQVVAAFKAAEVLDRTRFIGWVNTRLYAQVADVFLDTFPFPCGFTLFQAMAAAKPVVIYDSPEAAQTGLWNFIKPLVQDGEGTPEERAELCTFIGDEECPLIAVARTSEDYVRHAGRLITDVKARAKAGDASRRFMARYFSDPRVMGSSLADHFIDLIEDKRAPKTVGGSGGSAPTAL